MVKPLPKGKVGGEKRSSTLDGIGFSGMSSKSVPPEGLMSGEPGTLLYIDPTTDNWPSGHDKPYLQLEGYIDEAEFSALMQRLSMTAAPVRKAIEQYQEAYLNSVPAAREFVERGAMMFKATPRWIRYSYFNKEPPELIEIQF